jgi:hypothetical protein
VTSVPFEDESTTTDLVGNRCPVVQREGSRASRTGPLRLHDSRSKIQFVGDCTVPVRVLGKVARTLVLKQNGREANPAIVDIKSRMEA